MSDDASEPERYSRMMDILGVSHGWRRTEEKGTHSNHDVHEMQLILPFAPHK